MVSSPSFWLAVLIAFLLGWFLDWLWELVYFRHRRYQWRDDRVAQLEASLRAKDRHIAELQRRLESMQAGRGEVEAGFPIADETEVEEYEPLFLEEPAPQMEAEAEMVSELSPTETAVPMPEPAPARAPVVEVTLSEPPAGVDMSAARETAAILASVGQIPVGETPLAPIEEKAAEIPRPASVTGLPEGLVPDDLTRIRGIGEVFEQRLYAAGVLTYAQLAALSPQELASILVPQVRQESELADIIAQATALAEGSQAL